MVVEKASSNSGMSVTFYTYYWTTNRHFKVETALLQFLSNLNHSFTGLSTFPPHTNIIWVIYHISDMLIAASPFGLLWVFFNNTGKCDEGCYKSYRKYWFDNLSYGYGLSLDNYYNFQHLSVSHTAVVSFLCEKGVRCSLGFISLCLSCNELGGLWGSGLHSTLPPSEGMKHTVPFKSKLTLDSRSQHESWIESRIETRFSMTTSQFSMRDRKSVV